MKQSNQKIYLAAGLILLLLGATILQPLLGWAKAGQPKTKGITISYSEEILTPFSIIAIKAKGIDPTAPTAVVFKLSDGTSKVVPALSVSANKVEVQVPPGPYSPSENTFTGENLSIKVIQTKTANSQLTTTASNEVGQLLFSYADTLDAYSGYSKNPRPKVGELTRSYLAASLDSLKIADKKTAKKNIDHALFAAGETNLQTLLNAVEKIISDPTAKITVDQTVIDAPTLNKLDIILASYFGLMKDHHLTDNNENIFAFLLPAAQAAGQTECDRQMAEVDAAYARNILGVPCLARQKAMDADQKAAKLLPEAVKFVYSFPLVLSGMSLEFVAEDLSLSAAAKIGLAGAFSFATEALVEGKVAVTNGAQSVAKAVTDHQLAGPFSEIGLPMAKLFYEVNEALHPAEAKQEASQTAILPTADNAGLAIYSNTDGKNSLTTIGLPKPSQSAVATIGSTQIIKLDTSLPQPTATTIDNTVVTPTPTPAPDTIPPPTPVPTPTPTPTKNCPHQDEARSPIGLYQSCDDADNACADGIPSDAADYYHQRDECDYAYCLCRSAIQLNYYGGPECFTTSDCSKVITH